MKLLTMHKRPYTSQMTQSDSMNQKIGRRRFSSIEDCIDASIERQEE